MYMRIAGVKSYDRKRVHDGESMHFPAARCPHVANRRQPRIIVMTSSSHTGVLPTPAMIMIDIIYDARCVTNASFIHVTAVM